jgi:hypothetical protein
VPHCDGVGGDLHTLSFGLCAKDACVLSHRIGCALRRLSEKRMSSLMHIRAKHTAAADVHSPQASGPFPHHGVQGRLGCLLAHTAEDRKEAYLTGIRLELSLLQASQLRATQNPMAQRDDNHERASLIPRQDAPRTSQKRGQGRTRPATIVFLLALWVLCAGSSDELVQPPQLRVVESIYCRVFFANDPSVVGPGGSIPEELCKNPWVQQQVASLRGWQLFFDCVPGTCSDP